jgi:hypothetical protein
MTRKDYVAIADALASVMSMSQHVNEQETVRWVAEHLCDVFVADNARFDREKFLAACEAK